MKAIINFVIFLKTGKFGPLMLGDARSKVVRLLGEPDYWTDKNSGVAVTTASAFHYFGVLVVFEGDEVDSITLSTRVNWTNSPVEWEGSFIGDNFIVEDFKVYLKEKAVEFVPNVELDVFSDAVMQTEGGVIVYARHHFTSEEKEDGSTESRRSQFRYIDTFVKMNPLANQ